MKYEVPIIYKGQANYIVEANSPDEASDIACAKFRNNDKADTLGNEWEEIQNIGEVVAI